MTTRHISDFVPDISNANRGTERGRALLEQSLRQYGAGRSILVDREGRIIAGNKTLETAGAIGLEDVIVVQTDGKKIVAVQRMDLDLATDETARMLAYADNRVGEIDLDFDPEQLLADMTAGLPLEDFWRKEELDELLAEIMPPPEPVDAEPQVERAEELRQLWDVQLGQMWLLDSGKGHPHRLICGDCTDPTSVARVMGGERAAICFTSPPYNAGKTPTEEKQGEQSKYDDDTDSKSQDDYLFLLESFTRCALLVSDYVFVNIQCLSGNKRALLAYWFNHLDDFADVAIWDKKNAQPAMARRVMDSRFEFVIILGGNGSRAIGTRDFRGMVHNVYDGQPQRQNDFADSHAATFPVDLPLHFIGTFTNRGEIVYEPFSGSGTCIIACENLSRQCRAVEISPRYVAVCLQRWADATTCTPVLLES